MATDPSKQQKTKSTKTRNPAKVSQPSTPPIDPFAPKTPTPDKKTEIAKKSTLLEKAATHHQPPQNPTPAPSPTIERNTNPQPIQKPQTPQPSPSEYVPPRPLKTNTPQHRSNPQEKAHQARIALTENGPAPIPRSQSTNTPIVAMSAKLQQEQQAAKNTVGGKK